MSLCSRSIWGGKDVPSGQNPASTPESPLPSRTQRLVACGCLLLSSGQDPHQAIATHTRTTLSFWSSGDSHRDASRWQLGGTWPAAKPPSMSSGQGAIPLGQTLANGNGLRNSQSLPADHPALGEAFHLDLHVCFI